MDKLKPQMTQKQQSHTQIEEKDSMFRPILYVTSLLCCDFYVTSYEKTFF